MSTVSPKIGRLTNEIHLASIGAALEAGYRAGAGEGSLEDFLRDADLWSFDPRESKAAPAKKPRKAKEDGDKPKPRKSSGAWVDDPELAEKPFDPAFCNCRKWNAGHGAQCNRVVDEDGLCTHHKKQYDKIIEEGGLDLSHGRYNDERPTHCLRKPDDDHAHPWKDLKKDKKEKKEKKEKEKKEKKVKKKKDKKEKKKKEKKEKKEEIVDSGEETEELEGPVVAEEQVVQEEQEVFIISGDFLTRARV